MDFNFGDFGGQQKTASELASEASSGNFDVMPAHKNQLIIESLEVKKNDSTGTINLSVVMQIVGEQYNGRKIWNNYNLVKKDQSLNDISQYQLGALALSVGYPEDQVLKSPLELESYVNIPFQGDVKIKKGSGSYGDSNEVANPKAIGVAAPTPKAQQQAAPQPAAQGFAPQAGGFGQAKGFGQQ